MERQYDGSEDWRIHSWELAFRMILAAAVLTGFVAGCRKSLPPAPLPPPAVTVAQPLQKEITDWNEYTGRLTAVESVEVRPRVSGYVDSVHFVEGQEVEEGTLLFVIDKRPFEAEVSRAKARLSQAKAAQSLAKANLERAKKLASTQVISKEEADIRVREAMQADADVEQAAAQLDSANLQLGFTDVRSPITGIAGRYLVTRGNVVQGGSGEGTLLTTIVPHDPIYVYFEADEAAVISAIRRYFEGGQPGRGDPGSRPVEMQLSDEKIFLTRARSTSLITSSIPRRTPWRCVAGLQIPTAFHARHVCPRAGAIRWSEAGDSCAPGSHCLRFDGALRLGVEVRRHGGAPAGGASGGRHGSLRVVRDGLTAGDKVVIKGIQILRPDVKVTPHEGSIADPEDAPADGNEIFLPVTPAGA